MFYFRGRQLYHNYGFLEQQKKAFGLAYKRFIFFFFRIQRFNESALLINWPVILVRYRRLMFGIKRSSSRFSSNYYFMTVYVTA